MKKAALQIKDFSFFYQKGIDKVHALSNINLSVPEQEFVSIVGPSGSGKTTLLYSIGGLLKKDPTSRGEITLNIDKYKNRHLNISTVFQDSALLPWRNVLKNVLYGLEMQKKTKDRASIKKLIKLVGLAGFEKFYPHQLSGGMKQRVNLARALATDPSLLLMDEPFSSLDAQTREFMQEELMRIWDKKKITVVFVTHQINEAVYLSDRVIVLSKRPGKVRKVIKVDLSRPRKLEVKMTKKFISIEKSIWKLIKDER